MSGAAIHTMAIVASAGDRLLAAAAEGLERVDPEDLRAQRSAIEAMSARLAEDPSRLRAALEGGSLPWRAAAILALGRMERGLARDEAEAVFAAASSGPAWLRVEALDALLDAGESPRRLIELAREVADGAHDEDLRERAAMVVDACLTGAPEAH